MKEIKVTKEQFKEFVWAATLEIIKEGWKNAASDIFEMLDNLLGEDHKLVIGPPPLVNEEQVTGITWGEVGYDQGKDVLDLDCINRKPEDYEGSVNLEDYGAKDTFLIDYDHDGNVIGFEVHSAFKLYGINEKSLFFSVRMVVKTLLKIIREVEDDCKRI